jgi:hypothetical protein
VVLDYDTVNEEVVHCTTRSGTTLTVTRGADGSAAVAHTSGAGARHGVSARDFSEPNVHVNTSHAKVTFQATEPGAPTTGEIWVDSDASTPSLNPADYVTSVTQQAQLGDRNLVQNGAMTVAQRSSSVAGITAGGYFTADRWYTALGTIGTWTQSVENDAPTGSGFRKSLKMLVTTADASPAAADLANVAMAFEGQDLQRIRKGTASAQTLTMSFWVKANVTGTYTAWLYDNDNGRSVSAAYTISASATWEYKTITFPADATGVFDNDNAASLYLNFGLGFGSDYTSGTLATAWAAFTAANRNPGQVNVAAAISNYWQVTGIQLETGSAATPYEFEDYGSTLRKCQRYYQRRTATGAWGTMGAGWGTSATGVYVPIQPVVPMRTSPSTVEYSALQVTDAVAIAATVTACAVNTDERGDAMFILGITVASGLTASRPYALRANNSTAAYLGFSADL